MNKNSIKKALIGTFFCLGILLNSGKVLAESSNWERYYPEYKVGYYLKDAPADKKITVTFSKSVDKETICARNIEIMDEGFKNEVSADFKFLDESKIQIIPRSKLKSGQIYYLIMHDGIKGENGSNLKNGIIAVLKVKEEHIDQIDPDNPTDNPNVDNNFQIIGESLSRVNFVKAVVPAAVDGYKKYKVFPSITVAQSILESAWGTSDKALKCNNLFGIKANEKWTGSYLELPTKEWENGKVIDILDKWRVYSNINESIEDHGEHIKTTPCYRNNGVFDAENYKEQASAISKAGYATDPQYAEKLCILIDRYSLWKLDENGKLIN